MTLTRMLVGADTVAADRKSFLAVTLGWRLEPDAAVAAAVVITAHERRNLATGLLQALKRTPRVFRPVLDGVEQRLRVGGIFSLIWRRI
jgi:hypothetical protein